MNLGEENVPNNEELAIERLHKLVRSIFQRDYALNPAPVRRPFHAKSHGCVSAFFTVDQDIPDDLRVGVFKAPRTYSSWIRFSNASALIQSDWKLDGRGMSIKLVDVAEDESLENESHRLMQDFVMINHPVFFVRNAMDFAEFSSRITKPSVPLSFFFGWNPLKWRLHEFITLLRTGLKWVSSPLAIQYWSQTPYKLGSKAIKFSAKPSALHNKGIISFGHDRLRHGMTVQLQEEVRFEFLIQVQKCATRMPIEDATIVWPESVSQYIRLATIKIPPQDFNTTQRLQFDENLSFAPWHSLPEHRPIGGINRARRSVYESMSELRHEMNDRIGPQDK